MILRLALLCSFFIVASANVDQSLLEETERFLNKTKEQVTNYYTTFISETSLYLFAIRDYYTTLTVSKYQYWQDQNCPFNAADSVSAKLKEEAGMTIYWYTLKCDIYTLKLKSQLVSDEERLKIIFALNPPDRFLEEIKNATQILNDKGRKLLKGYVDSCENCLTV